MDTHLVDAPLRGLDPGYYTDPARYAQIRDRVLERAWHYACHESQVPEAGDYCALTVLDQDVFVIRGRDGGLRAFYNVCQHRGHRLVEDTGRTTTLVCPYHAWSYHLDGRLKGAPNARTTPGFDKARICLTPVRLDSLLGFVFVTLDPDAPSLADTFPGVEDAILAACPDIRARAFAHQHTADERCNWLVAVENYNECYHCGHVHKAFAQGVILPESYDIQPMPGARVLRHSSQAASGQGRWYERQAAEGAPGDYASFFLWPLFSLQIYPGGLVNTYHWRPLGHDSTVVHRGWFSGDGVVDDTLQAVIDLDRDTTFAEDLVLVANVQRGLGSKGYRPGPLVISPSHGIQSEHSIAALHRWLIESLS